MAVLVTTPSFFAERTAMACNARDLASILLVIRQSSTTHVSDDGGGSGSIVTGKDMRSVVLSPTVEPGATTAGVTSSPHPLHMSQPPSPCLSPSMMSAASEDHTSLSSGTHVCFWIDASQLQMDAVPCHYLASVVIAHFLLHNHTPVHPKVQSMVLVDTAPAQFPRAFVERYAASTAIEPWQRIYHTEHMVPTAFRRYGATVDTLQDVCRVVQKRAQDRPDWGNTLALVDLEGVLVTRLGEVMPELLESFVTPAEGRLVLATAMGMSAAEVRTYLSTTLGETPPPPLGPTTSTTTPSSETSPVRVVDALYYFRKHIEPLCRVHQEQEQEQQQQLKAPAPPTPHPRTYCPSEWWMEACCRTMDDDA